MSENFTTYAPLTDFSLIEKAVQSFFVSLAGGSFVAPPNDDSDTRESFTASAGQIAFYTAFQSLTFQQCRPRVFIGLHSVNPIQGAYIIDANGNIREKAWSGQIGFGIVTEPNYSLHTQLRSQVLAAIQQVICTISPDNSTFATTGINPFLTFHEVSQFYATNTSTAVSEEEGAYQSTLSVAINFGVKPNAWPSNTQTT